MLSGRSVPRSVLASVAAELVTIHGQADQLRIATVSRQREFLDRYAGDEVALPAYGKTWNALQRNGRAFGKAQQPGIVHAPAGGLPA